MNYVKQGYQEMAFNDDLKHKDVYLLSELGSLFEVAGRIAKMPIFEAIQKYKDPKNNCKSYIINDRKGNIYEVLQDDIDELGVNAPATLIREVIE